MTTKKGTQLTGELLWLAAAGVYVACSHHGQEFVAF